MKVNVRGLGDDIKINIFTAAEKEGNENKVTIPLQSNFCPNANAFLSKIYLFLAKMNSFNKFWSKEITAIKISYAFVGWQKEMDV